MTLVFLVVGASQQVVNISLPSLMKIVILTFAKDPVVEQEAGRIFWGSCSA